MIGESRALETLVGALSVEGADEAEASLFSRAGGLTRFADSAIHQATERSDASVRVRVITGRRSAAVTTNRLDPDSLAAAGRRALETAHLAPPDEIFPGLPGDSGASLPVPDRFDGQTAGASPAWRAEVVKGAVAAAAPRPAAGFFGTEALEAAVANTAGTRRYSRWTAASFSCLVSSGDGSAYEQTSTWRGSELDAARLSEELAEWADMGRGAEDTAPGSYPVVLMPLAVAELVEYLSYMGFGAKDLANG
ncbi:MAG: PmbA/TldA family metallopeptidase, partial [Acidimicrobiales bacterium]